MWDFFLLETTTLHPYSPSLVTMALPIPVDDAVTTATLPFIDIDILLIELDK
jgi:hypothetical protein